MKRSIAAAAIAMAAALGVLAAGASASQPPGLRGYEGQPGNQGGH